MELSISSQISTQFAEDEGPKAEAIAVWRKMAKYIVAHMKNGFFSRLNIQKQTPNGPERVSKL